MILRWILLTALCLSPTFTLLAKETMSQGKYKNFRVAIYVVVNRTSEFSDLKLLRREFDRVMSQVKFDKVYLEVYRNRHFAAEADIEKVKKFFTDEGIIVSGGITLAAGGHAGQFGTFDYENAEDRAECKRAVELAARHFDEVILDDFFFYTSKSDEDIAAKGKRSWTQYRLDTMRQASQELVLKPAKAINSNVKMIIKYPNWYEHFQGLGYDLEKQSQMFDAIYTGTETRDPVVTDQLLQQYESYEIFRYFSNIRPDGGNLGGWVDTYSTRYVDRYAEQLWDTMLAKAPEITLFNWHPMAETKTVEAGDRDAWKNKPSSFNWDAMIKSFKPGKGDEAGPGWGRAAGYALEQIDPLIGKLGKPIGLMSYKPYQSSGEDFLHNYLGNIGIPIELTPRFPKEADIVLLTECAKFDPEIVAKIKGQLAAGKNVVITSGLLRALHGKGIEDIIEAELTGRAVPVRDFLNGFGAGNGSSLNDPKRDNPAILFPELHFFTNDAWPVIRGVAAAKGFPILLMNRYSKGIIYVLTMPENIADIYNLPQGVITAIKGYLLEGMPVQIDSPAHVSLFTYDNHTFVLQSFKEDEAMVTVSLPEANATLKNLMTGQTIKADKSNSPGSHFTFAIQPHSYMGFEIEK